MDFNWKSPRGYTGGEIYNTSVYILSRQSFQQWKIKCTDTYLHLRTSHTVLWMTNATTQLWRKLTCKFWDKEERSGTKKVVGQQFSLFVCMTNIESVLSYSPREVLVVFLPDAQTTSHILPPNEELASIWERASNISTRWGNFKQISHICLVRHAAIMHFLHFH